MSTQPNIEDRYFPIVYSASRVLAVGEGCRQMCASIEDAGAAVQAPFVIFK